jgi:hypothetical protein
MCGARCVVPSCVRCTNTSCQVPSCTCGTTGFSAMCVAGSTLAPTQTPSPTQSTPSPTQSTDVVPVSGPTGTTTTVFGQATLAYVCVCVCACCHPNLICLHSTQPASPTSAPVTVTQLSIHIAQPPTPATSRLTIKTQVVVCARVHVVTCLLCRQPTGAPGQSVTCSLSTLSMCTTSLGCATGQTAMCTCSTPTLRRLAVDVL